MSGRQGQGNRITKPPSSKQRAQAKRHSATVILGSGAGLPESSWWATPLTRAEFDAEAARQRARLAVSKFGGYRGNGIREQD